MEAAGLELAQELGEGDAGADPQIADGALDPGHVAGAVEEDRPGQVPQPLGHPEAHVGRPRDDGRVGMGRVEADRLVLALGQQGGAVLDRGHRPGRRLGHRGGGQGRGGRRRPAPSVVRRFVRRGRGRVAHPARHRLARRRLGRPHDGRIARAAAEVARERDVVVPLPVQVRDRHRHHEARRAEPALAPVVVHHRPLDGVERAVGAGDPLDRPHRRPDELRQEQDAGVERARAAVVGHHHGAGAAVALVAALLGARQAALLAQPVEQGPRGRGLGPDPFSVEEKLHQHGTCPPRYRVSLVPGPSMRRRRRGEGDQSGRGGLWQVPPPGGRAGRENLTVGAPPQGLGAAPVAATPLSPIALPDPLPRTDSDGPLPHPQVRPRRHGHPLGRRRHHPHAAGRDPAAPGRRPGDHGRRLLRGAPGQPRLRADRPRHHRLGPRAGVARRLVLAGLDRPRHRRRGRHLRAGRGRARPDQRAGRPGLARGRPARRDGARPPRAAPRGARPRRAMGDHRAHGDSSPAGPTPRWRCPPRCWRWAPRCSCAGPPARGPRRPGRLRPPRWTPSSSATSRCSRGCLAILGLAAAALRPGA